MSANPPNVDFYPTDWFWTFSVYKTPMLNTAVPQADSGFQIAWKFQPEPRWKFQLTYEVIKQTPNILSGLLAFFLAKRGAWENFLFHDDGDDHVTGQQFGIGDGTTATFQLTRLYNGVPVAVRNIDNGISNTPFGGTPGPHLNGVAAPNIYVGGVLQIPTSYTIDFINGTIFFIVPPASGALTADFTFYYRVRFDKDSQDFEEFANQFWRTKQISFTSIPRRSS